MTTHSKDERRQRVGYGSTYTQGSPSGSREHPAIDTVLGGQVWLVKPDQAARTRYPCLWMQTGVVEFKDCNNFYDCTRCRYDAGMHRRVAQGKQISWQDAMRRRAALDRQCRHSLSGRIGARVCAHDYTCAKCDFDQLFEDVWSSAVDSRTAASHAVKGFEVPTDRYFHTGHTWACIESGGYYRIGLDDFAHKIFGTADRLELPLVGQEVHQGSAAWGLQRKDHRADVLAPVSGVVTAVNARARKDPAATSQHPYSQGWLMTVHTSDVKASAKSLMAGADTLAWMDSEVETLEQMVEAVAGPLAADGGHLQADIYGNLPQLGWQNLARTFLKTT